MSFIIRNQSLIISAYQTLDPLKRQEIMRQYVRNRVPSFQLNQKITITGPVRYSY